MPEDALRLAGAIAFEALALIIWNVGSRAPRQLFADLRASFATPRRVLLASLVTLLGLIFFMTAIVLLVPVLVDPPSQFSPVTIGTLLVALLVDFLIGNDVRSLIFSRRET